MRYLVGFAVFVFAIWALYDFFTGHAVADATAIITEQSASATLAAYYPYRQIERVVRIKGSGPIRYAVYEYSELPTQDTPLKKETWITESALVHCPGLSRWAVSDLSGVGMNDVNGIPEGVTRKFPDGETWTKCHGQPVFIAPNQ